jgi:hypothetical protein
MVTYLGFARDRKYWEKISAGATAPWHSTAVTVKTASTFKSMLTISVVQSAKHASNECAVPAKRKMHRWNAEHDGYTILILTIPIFYYCVAIGQELSYPALKLVRKRKKLHGMAFSYFAVHETGGTTRFKVNSDASQRYIRA